MSKMSEYHSVTCGTDKGSTQNYRYLQSKSVDELLDEVTDYIFSVSEDSADVDVINAYLDVLDEKNPLPLKIDTNKTAADFKKNHSLLLKK